MNAIAETLPRAEITAAMLRDTGYEVSEAGSGGAALDVLDAESKKIDLIIIDLGMPGMSGADVARLVQARRPGLPTLFVTALPTMLRSPA